MSAKAPDKAAAAAARGGRKAGRRPGDCTTRDEILEAARSAFAEHGYDRATIRGIAAQASVDPALVIHFFGPKERLFSAALQIPVEPAEILARVRVQAPDEMGPALVRAFLSAWEPAETRTPLIATLRSAMTNDTAMDLVREHLERRVFGPITQALQTDDAQLRATLIGSQFIGMAMMRYVACVQPLASASVDELVAAVGPTVQRYLTGDLGDAADA